MKRIEVSRPGFSFPARKKTIRFITLGCKANQYDTQSIRERFLERGFKEVFSDSSAGYFLVNTCTVTSGADQKSRNLIRRCIHSSPGAFVIVTGCMAEKDWKTLAAIEGVGLIAKKSFFPEGITAFNQRTRAFLKIQDGCDNFCSYCKVALVRGRKRSKPIKQILKEAGSLAEHGYKEIVLTGICLGQYGSDLGGRIDLGEVVGRIEEIKGIRRIRLSSIEAKDVSPGLLKRFSGSKKLCRHLHIPLQSGDDRVLKMMNRKYTSCSYRRLVERAREKIPDVSITTDCLVGFPGETKENFLNTIRLIRRIKPLKVHIFPYSPRPGTKAFGFRGEVGAPAVKSRCLELEKAAEECRDGFMRGFLGREFEVLLEGPLNGRAGGAEGLTDNYLKVLLPFSRSNKPFVSARLKDMHKGCFIGECIDNS